MIEAVWVRADVMAAGGARARADYDYLIKLLLIGDSGTYSPFLCLSVDLDVLCIACDPDDHEARCGKGWNLCGSYLGCRHSCF